MICFDLPAALSSSCSALADSSIIFSEFNLNSFIGSDESFVFYLRAYCFKAVGVFKKDVFVSIGFAYDYPTLRSSRGYFFYSVVSILFSSVFGA